MPDALKAAPADGRIAQAMIDEAAFRVVRAHIRAGLFDTPLPAAPEADVSTPADQAVARASDPGHLTNGAFALPEPLQVSLSQSTRDGSVSHHPVTIGFTTHCAQECSRERSRSR